MSPTSMLPLLLRLRSKGQMLSVQQPSAPSFFESCWASWMMCLEVRENSLHSRRRTLLIGTVDWHCHKECDLSRCIDRLQCCFAMKQHLLMFCLKNSLSTLLPCLQGTRGGFLAPACPGG